MSDTLVDAFVDLLELVGWPFDVLWYADGGGPWRAPPEVMDALIARYVKAGFCEDADECREAMEADLGLALRDMPLVT